MQSTLRWMAVDSVPFNRFAHSGLAPGGNCNWYSVSAGDDVQSFDCLGLNAGISGIRADAAAWAAAAFALSTWVGGGFFRNGGISDIFMRCVDADLL